jgi:hypothetical protein
MNFNSLEIGALDIYQGGFKLTGADSNGVCTQNKNLFLGGDPIVNFLEDVTYGCQIQMNSTLFQSFCNSPSLSTYDIFSNINFAQYFGSFGNANFYF